MVGSMPLVPHVLNLLSKKSVPRGLSLANQSSTGDRKALGRVLHDRAVQLHDRVDKGGAAARPAVVG